LPAPRVRLFALLNDSLGAPFVNQAGIADPGSPILAVGLFSGLIILLAVNF
jgi:hypothetical protein